MPRTARIENAENGLAREKQTNSRIGLCEMRRTWAETQSVEETRLATEEQSAAETRLATEEQSAAETRPAKGTQLTGKAQPIGEKWCNSSVTALELEHGNRGKWLSGNMGLFRGAKGLVWLGIVGLLGLFTLGLGEESALAGVGWDSATRTLSYGDSDAEFNYGGYFTCAIEGGVSDSKFNVNTGKTLILYKGITFDSGTTLSINSEYGNPTYSSWGTIKLNLPTVSGTANITVRNGTLHWYNENKAQMTSGSTITVNSGAELKTTYLFRQQSGTATTIQLNSGSTWNLNSINTGSGHNADDALLISGGGGLIIQGSGTMNIASGCVEISPGGGGFSSGKAEFKMSAGGKLSLASGTVFRNGGENQNNKHADWSKNYGNLEVNGSFMFWDGGTDVYAYALSGDSTGNIGFGTPYSSGVLHLGNNNGSDPGGSYNYYGVISSGIGNDVNPTITSSSLALVKEGSYDQRLHGANTYTGGTTIKNGVLTVTHNTALGTGDVSLEGGTLKLDDNSITVGNSINITGDNASFRAGGTATDRVYTISGKISGKCLQVANECGRAITLSNSNNDFDGLRIGNGVNSVTNTTRYAAIAMGADNSLGKGLVTFETKDSSNADVYATLNMGGYSNTGRAVTGLSGGNANSLLTNSSSTVSTMKVDVAENASYTYAGKITGNVAFTKAGAGTQTLQLSDTDSTFASAINVEAGTLVLDRSGMSEQDGSNARSIFNQSTDLNVTVNGTLQIKSSVSTSDGCSVHDGHYIAASLGSVINTSGYASNGTFNLYGSGTFEVVQGRVEFFRTDVKKTVTIAMSDGGSIQIDNGAEFRTGGNLGSSQNTVDWSSNKGDLNVKAGGKFIIWDDTPVYFDALNGDNNRSNLAYVTSGGGTSTRTLYIGVGNGDGDFGGIIEDTFQTGTQRTIVLTKRGTGTQILRHENTYHGGTVIEGGTLQLDDYGTLGYGTIDIRSGAALTINNSVNAVFSSTVIGAGSLTYQNGKSYTQTGAIGTSDSNFSGTVSVAEGSVLQLGDSSNTTNSYLSGTLSSAGEVRLSNGSLTLNGTGNSIATLSGSGDLTLASGKTLSLGTSTGSGSITLNGALTITGAGSLGHSNITGNGSVTITTANSSDVVAFTRSTEYGGGTIITKGTLQADNRGTFGTAGIEVQEGAALVFNNAIDPTHGSTITGSGSVTYQGGRSYTHIGAIGTSDSNFGGTLSVVSGTSLQLGNDNTATNSYISGSVTVAGTLTVNSSSTLTLNGTGNSIAALGGSGNITLASGKTLSLGTSTGSGSITLNGDLTITGAGSLDHSNITGSGSVTITMANSTDVVAFTRSTEYGGGTTITKGTLRADNHGTFGLAGIEVQEGAALVFNNTVDPTHGNTITGAGSVTYQGGRNYTHIGAIGTSDSKFGGTVTIASGSTLQLGNANYTTNSYITDTLTADGALTISSGSSLSVAALAGSASVTNNGALTLTGAGTVANQISGGGSVTISTANALDRVIFTQANTYEGNTTLTRGELQLNRSDALRTNSQLDMTDEAKLILNYGGESTDHTFGHVVTGAGQIVYHGQGTERFASGLNDFTGTILVDNGGTMVLATGTGTGARVWVNGCSAEITTGGSVDTVTVDDGFVVVNGGTVDTLNLNDTTDTSLVSSGSVNTLTMGEGSSLTVAGGTIDDLVVGESVVLNLTGEAENSIGRLVLGDNSTLSITPLDSSSASSGYNVASDLLLGTGIALEITLDENVIKDGMYQMVRADHISGSTDSFSSVTVHQGSSTMTFTDVSTYINVSGDSINLNTKAVSTAVPEPGTWLLMALGVLGILRISRRKK